MSIWRRATPAASQPYLNLKVDADDNGSIDTTLTYVHTPIPLNTWTAVDTINSTATGAAGWFCRQHGGDLPESGLTWTQVLDLLPDGAVFQNSLGSRGR